MHFVRLVIANTSQEEQMSRFRDCYIVQDAFTELNAERILRYKPFCLQVRMTYMNLSDMGLSQDEIFEKMADWLQDATHEDRSSCEVIISYFIQKCEVFDAIAE